jgi:hypothetical protein
VGGKRRWQLRLIGDVLKKAGRQRKDCYSPGSIDPLDLRPEGWAESVTGRHGDSGVPPCRALKSSIASLCFRGDGIETGMCPGCPLSYRPRHPRDHRIGEVVLAVVDKWSDNVTDHVNDHVTSGFVIHQTKFLRWQSEFSIGLRGCLKTAIVERNFAPEQFEPYARDLRRGVENMRKLVYLCVLRSGIFFQTRHRQIPRHGRRDHGLPLR